MSGFDLAVGFDGPTMDQAGEAAYRQLYPQLFTGQQHVSRDGIEFDVSWDVEAPPRFVLHPPEEGEAVLRAHLEAHLNALPGGLAHEDVVQGYLATLQDSVFQMVMDDMTMTVSGEGGTGTDPVRVTVIVRAEVEGGTMRLRPLKAVGTTDNPSDEWFINAVILPQAMEMADRLLAGVTLPPLEFSGVRLGPPVMTVAQDRVIALAALEGRPAPAPPFPDAWPQSPFFVVLSEEAKLAVARAGTASMAGQRFGDSGKVDIGIGDAHYGATAVIQRVEIGPGAPGTPELAFTGPIAGNVNAGIKIGCTNFGVNYNLYAAPQPRGTIALELSGRQVGARTTHLDTFVLLITPNGSPVEWLLSALTTPLLQAVAAAFSPLITKAFEGIRFDVMQLQPIPIDVEGIHLRVEPVDVRFAPFGGLTSIQGTARITG